MTYLISIPKCEMSLDGLVAMKTVSMSCATCELVRCREYVLTTLALSMTCSQNVQWVSIKLTPSIVRMAMEGATIIRKPRSRTQGPNVLLANVFENAQPMSYAQPPCWPYTVSSLLMITSGYFALPKYISTSKIRMKCGLTALRFGSYRM